MTNFLCEPGGGDATIDVRFELSTTGRHRITLNPLIRSGLAAVCHASVRGQNHS